MVEEHDGKVSIGGRHIPNMRFADGIDALAEDEQEPEALVEGLDYCNKLQISWSSCLKAWLKSGDPLNDCTSLCSSFKVEANLER